jgi:lysophospholipase L1-like esterase
MANNLRANIPAIVVCTVTTTFVAAGINTGNMSIIYLVDDGLVSYKPNRLINGITRFEAGKGYYLVPKVDLDFTAFLAPPLPITPPPDFTSAVIVTDGNSLTAGYLASAPDKAYPARLALIDPFAADGATVTNKGIGGQTTQQMIDDATTDVDPLYNAGVKSVLVAWEMGNDLYFNADVSGAETRFASYCAARQAAGWKVVVCNLPARDHSVTNGGVSPGGDSDAAYNTKRLSLNTWLAANWATFADGFVDLAADAAFTTFNSTYFNADRVHLTDAGYQKVADLVAPVIVSIY